MYKEFIYHRPKGNYAYAVDDNHVVIMLKTKKSNVEQVCLVYGDPHEWKNNKWITQTSIMEKSGTDNIYDYWTIKVAPKFRRLRYGFKCMNKKETWYYTERGFFNTLSNDISNYFCFPYVHQADVFNPPKWVKETIWYQIFPERFANGDKTINPPNTVPWGSETPKFNSFFGGDLQGIIDNLDYLVELGINGIYLTPIFRAPSNHKYDTIDYMEIDPQFGDKTTFKKLVKECHNRGIRVMLDAVFNHSGYYFKPFQDVLIHQEKSKYKDWFHIWEFPVKTMPKPNYDTFAFESTMPKLNTSNPDVKKYLLDVARYWIEEFNIDGWRLDVANEIDHSFWREFRRVVKTIKPDLYILGESWHDSMPWLEGDQFDAVMNYPLTDIAIDYFIDNKIDAQTFSYRIQELIHMYPSNVNEVAFNLIGSHDTPRILTRAHDNVDQVKLLALFQFSFYGTPSIYYGDEIGMTGGQDPGCRKCMIWDEEKQDHDLLNYMKSLINLRKSNPTFGNDGCFRFIKSDPKKNYIIYEKFNSKKRIIFFINNNNFEVDIPIINELTDHNTIEYLIDNKAHIHFVEPNFIKGSYVSIPSYGFRIFELTN